MVCQVIGIVIATYRKLDGSTYDHLKKALESIKNQTYKNYKVFLIGDDYTDNNELLELSNFLYVAITIPITWQTIIF
jgi:glycosyltransferase involved in cell wall biosynthesis